MFQKRMKQIGAWLLTLSMILGSVQLPSIGAKAADNNSDLTAEATASVGESKYTIYPTPQSVTYDSEEGTLTIPEEVNVVFESGIDQPTKNRLSEVLSVKNIKVKEVNEAVDGEVNILIGVAGSNGAAAAYAAENLEYDDDFFEKRDAYLLAIEENQITVVGKDTDAAFYALASLKMILEQSEGTAVYQLQMNDYSVGQYRGFIEGYYGIPWSVEDRISLMNFGGDFKMNVYIFAPKDDPYHNTNWRELYPAEELENIKKMVAAGTASKCRFVWAIHPFMNQAITLDNYDDTLDIVKAKFEQLYGAGVRQFVISADDAYSNPQVQVKLLNDMSAWVKAKGDCYNLAFVPMVYCTGAGSWYGSATSLTSYYATMQAVDEDVEFMWTGESVCYPATQYTFTHFKQVSGREPFMWLNWPVNDVNHARLVMGPAENCILNTGNVTGFMGIVTNPLEQAEASKTSLFAIADYAWNTKDFDCEKSWTDCFQYIDEGASESLHELCKHLTNPSPGGITQMSESKEIQPYVNAFQSAYQAGNDLTESGTALIEQYEKIVAAADDFQENGTNENLKDEMKPWVDSLREISEAGINFVKAAMALQKGEDVEAVIGYMKASTAYEASKNCAAPQLNNGTIMAESGAKVLMPFASDMSSSLKSDVEEVLNYSFGGSTAGGGETSTEISVIHSGLGGFYRGSTAEIIDGDESTFAWFNQEQSAGAYIGLDLGDVYRIDGVKILQGGAGGDAPNDIMANAILEYSLDGNNYTEIETIANERDINKDYTGAGITARYVRIRTATAYDKWYAIREFSVTKSPVSYSSYTNVEALGEIEADIQKNSAAIQTGDEGTDVTLKAGEYIGIELPSIREITSVTADYTENENLVLEGSLDGIEWTEVAEGEQQIDLSYIRIRNKGTEDVAFKLTELAVTNSDRDARFFSTVEWEEGHDPVYATDNSLTTSFRAKENGAGSLTWRISNPEKTGLIYILTHPGTAKDAKVSVQISDNTWVEKGSLADGLTIVNNLERYDSVKAVKIEWTDVAPEIVEMYTTEQRAMGITLNKESATINVTETLKLEATAYTEQDKDIDVSWKSDNTEIATVDENGLVTGVAGGTAVITAIGSNGMTNACTVTVVVPVSGVTVSGTPSEALEIGGKITVTVAVEPENADNKNVIWTSSNPVVATVENGVITAVGEGEAVITVKTEQGGFEKSFTVKVNKAQDNSDKNDNGNKPPVTNPEPIKAGETVELASGRYQIISAEKKTAKLVQAKNKNKASITIPAQITIKGVKCKVVQVGLNAFKGFKKLKKITLTKNITTIGKNAFNGCTKLSSVVVKGTSLKTIKAGAFKKTSKKMTVKFASKKVTAKKRAALLKKMKKAGMSKSAKLK